MKIRKTKLEELPILMKMYETARTFMASHGNPTQWGTSYPSLSLIESDIASGYSYVCEDHGKVIGTFYFRQGTDDNYARIYNGDWLNEAPYGVVHRIVSDGTVKGTAGFCLDWALSQCANLKIDTHRNNHVMQHVLEKFGFTYCGLIYNADGTERLAYQKTIS